MEKITLVCLVAIVVFSFQKTIRNHLVTVQRISDLYQVEKKQVFNMFLSDSNFELTKNKQLYEDIMQNNDRILKMNVVSKNH